MAPGNADGAVRPHDDPEIDPRSSLVRYINPEYHLVFDENAGRFRIGSGAFSATSGDPFNGMSVDVGQSMAAAGLAAFERTPRGFGAVEIDVGDARSLQLQVGTDPLPGNPFHGQIWGVKSSKRAKLHRLVKGWLVALDGVAIR